MKTRTLFVAVSGVNDETFRKYSDACEWLDKVSPATSTADGGTDDGVRTVLVRHVAR